MSEYEDRKPVRHFEKVEQVFSKYCPHLQAELIQGKNTARIACAFSNRCKGTLDTTGAQSAEFTIQHCEYVFQENATASETKGSFRERIKLPPYSDKTNYRLFED